MCKLKVVRASLCSHHEHHVHNDRYSIHHHIYPPPALRFCSLWFANWNNNPKILRFTFRRRNLYPLKQECITKIIISASSLIQIVVKVNVERLQNLCSPASDEEPATLPIFSQEDFELDCKKHLKIIVLSAQNH